MSDKKLLIKKKILRQIYFSSSIACSELSWKIKKSLPLTTKLVNELISDGYVLETGFAPSTGGRKAVMYSLKPDVLYIVSVALDQFVARIVIMDLHNRFASAIEKFELPLYKNPQALNILTDKIDHVIARSGIPRDRIAGIGVGMPGFVDAKKGPVLLNYGLEECRFMKPVYAGATIGVQLTCKEKIEQEKKDDNDIAKGIVKWLVQVSDETGEPVAVATILTMVAKKIQ